MADPPDCRPLLVGALRDTGAYPDTATSASDAGASASADAGAAATDGDAVDADNEFEGQDYAGDSSGGGREREGALTSAWFFDFKHRPGESLAVQHVHIGISGDGSGGGGVGGIGIHSVEFYGMVQPQQRGSAGWSPIEWARRGCWLLERRQRESPLAERVAWAFWIGLVLGAMGAAHVRKHACRCTEDCLRDCAGMGEVCRAECACPCECCKCPCRCTDFCQRHCGPSSDHPECDCRCQFCHCGALVRR